MKHKFSRIPEPEHMTEEEEILYAQANYSIPHEALVNDIIRIVGNNGVKNILDIGCGPGDVLLRLRRHVPAWTLTGVDISHRMLLLALKDEMSRIDDGVRPINWVLTNGNRFGFPDFEFDVIISNSVLHHVANAMSFWQEIRRIARPKAFILIRDLRRPSSFEEANDIVERNIPNEHEVVKQHYHSSLLSSYTCDEVQLHLQKSGISGLIVRELEDRYLTIEGQIILS